MIRTKIVCTIGPASRSPERLERLAKAGMDVARLNFSHGSHEEHGENIERVRHLADRAGKPVAVLQDLAGTKIRVGSIADEPVELQTGEPFTLTPREEAGSAERVTIGYPELAEAVEPGDPILLADGSIELRVESIEGEDVHTQVLVGGALTSGKGINLPTRSIRAPSLTEKDRVDLAFGLERGVDAVALSFVRRAEDVREAREAMRTSGREVPLIAKIEKHEALENIEEILEAVDGLMIARGDLGVEIPIENVPRIQKELIEKANRAGKPVITATQMLGSMTESPRPTRAEVTDVANAIWDGSDAVMLSEETATGAHPALAVETMARVAASAEQVFPYTMWTGKFGERDDLTLPEAVAHAATHLADRILARAVLTFTASGSTTRLVAKYRPRQPILAMTSNPETLRRLAFTWGAVPLALENVESRAELVREALRIAAAAGYLEPGDTVVITAGLPLHRPGTTNLVEVATVGQDR